MFGVELLVLGVLIGAALGVLWARAKNMAPWVRKPALDADTCDEVRGLLIDIAPKIQHLNEIFAEWPDAYGVLDEIVAQLTANGGKTMADAVVRLDKAAVVSAKAAVESASAAVESAKGAERLTHAVALLDAKMSMGLGSTLRTESAVEDAAALAVGVAKDLQDSYAEARSVSHDAPHGAAADAGSRGKPEGTVSNTELDSEETHEQS